MVARVANQIRNRKNCPLHGGQFYLSGSDVERNSFEAPDIAKLCSKALNSTISFINCKDSRERRLKTINLII